MFSSFLFIVYALVCTVILVILAPSPVHAVLFGVVFYVLYGSLFIAAGYDFAGVAIIIIYAGALMVMFLFVVMAFNLTRSVTPALVVDSIVSHRPWIISVGFLGLMGIILRIVRYLYFLSAGRPLNPLMLLVSNRRADFYFTFACSQSFESLLLSVGDTLYYGFPVPLALCGLLLLIGLISAVALTGYYRSFFAQRYLRPRFYTPASIQRRVILLRR